MLRNFEDDSRVTACQNEMTELPTPAPSSTASALPARALGAFGAKRRWNRRGAAVALVLGLTACGGGNDNPPAAATPTPEVPAPAPEVPAPPAPQPPAPPPAVDPVPTGFSKSVTNPEIFAADGTTDIGDRYVKDAGTATERTIVYDAVAAKYYELVTLVTPVTWSAARTAAQVGGGDLASPSTAAKLTFFKQAYVPDVDLPLGVAATGTNGAWIGLSQDPDALASGDGWTFLDSTALPAASPFWNAGEPNGGGGANQAGSEFYGAIFYGMTAAVTDLGMIYDAGQTAAPATDTQPKYLMEYTAKP